MTITHVATTTPDVSAPNAGTSDDVTWVGTGVANRLALLIGVMKYEAIQFAAVSGFTLQATLPGGSPTDGTTLGDMGMTRIGVWTKVMTGSETGIFNVAGVTTPNALRCGLSVYECTSGSWSVEVMTADDPTHGVGQSHAYSTWANAIAVGDVIVAAFANDTDNNATRTPSLIQSGITFGTLTDRINNRSTTGNDVGVYSVETTVTAGSNANAPTAAYTNASSGRCGPGAVIRIREVTAGPPPSGEAAMSVLMDLTGSGQKVGKGTAGTAGTVGLTAHGRKVARGSTLVTAVVAPEATAGKKLATGYASYGVSAAMETFDVVPPEVGALNAMATHTATVYNLVGEADEWSGERNEDPSIVDVPCSIIEQERVIRKPQSGTPTVARDAIGRFPDGTPIRKESRVTDSEGRIWSVVSTRQKRNPVWVGDVVAELLRVDQASL